jgi:Uma2 family endonuclease
MSMAVTERTFRIVALEDPEGHWELDRGRLREKPGMTASHNQLGFDLGVAITLQLDRREYRVRVDSARAKRSDETYYIPDVFVVPMRLVAPQLGRSDQLEIYEEPLPFVAEIWSPSTGGYDAAAKIPEYMKRGDLEIWLVHPYERTVIARQRQRDGSYHETVLQRGTVRLHALPEVAIDLDTLWELA